MEFLKNKIINEQNSVKQITIKPFVISSFKNRYIPYKASGKIKIKNSMSFIVIINSLILDLKVNRKLLYKYLLSLDFVNNCN